MVSDATRERLDVGPGSGRGNSRRSEPTPPLEAAPTARSGAQERRLGLDSLLGLGRYDPSLAGAARDVYHTL
jgi:hypothetical protein